jgi:hypothetical protein
MKLEGVRESRKRNGSGQRRNKTAQVGIHEKYKNNNKNMMFEVIRRRRRNVFLPFGRKSLSDGQKRLPCPWNEEVRHSSWNRPLGHVYLFGALPWWTGGSFMRGREFSANRRYTTVLLWRCTYSNVINTNHQRTAAFGQKTDISEQEVSTPRA